MKTLANCDNIEFLQQTYRIADAVKAYITETNILEIRKRIPETKGMNQEEKQAVLRKAAADNILEMVRVALVEHTEDTLTVLGLICFTEDKETIKNDRKLMTEAVKALTDESVLDFFISLMQSVVKISKAM